MKAKLRKKETKPSGEKRKRKTQTQHRNRDVTLKRALSTFYYRQKACPIILGSPNQIAFFPCLTQNLSVLQVTNSEQTYFVMVLIYTRLILYLLGKLAKYI